MTDNKKFVGNIKKLHANWNLYEKLLLGINLLVTIALLIYGSYTAKQDSNYWTIWVAFFGNIFNILSVILATKKRVICFFWGILAVIAFGAISLNQKAFGNMILYWAFYIPAQVVAWILWYKASENKIEIKPTKIKWWQIIIAIIFIVGFTSLFTYIETLKSFQKFWFGSSNNNYIFMRYVLDSTILVSSLAMTGFAWLRFRERWVLSIFIDTIQTCFWIMLALGVDQKPKADPVSANWIMAISSLTMLVAAIYGTYNWYKRQNK